MQNRAALFYSVSFEYGRSFGIIQTRHIIFKKKEQTMDISRKLAEFVANTRYEDIPAEMIEVE